MFRSSKQTFLTVFYSKIILGLKKHIHYQVHHVDILSIPLTLWVQSFYLKALNCFEMNIPKIKAALSSALHLLNNEIGTEITQKTKEEYMRVIDQVQAALKELP